MGPHRDKRSRSASVPPNKMKRKRSIKTMKGKIGKITGEIAYRELATKALIKKRRHNPRSNCTISGKKKRKILKQLKHMHKEASIMDVELVQPVTKKVREIEMTEVKPKPVKEIEMSAPKRKKNKQEKTQHVPEEKGDNLEQSTRRSRSKARRSKVEKSSPSEMDVDKT